MQDKSYYGGDTKFIKTDNLRDNIISEDFNHYLSDKGALKLKNVLLQPDDVIVTIIGANYSVVGRVARIFDDLGKSAINQNISLIRPKIKSGYLTTFLTGKYGKQQLYYLSRQTEQVNLNNVEVGDVIVAIPSKEFEEKIHNLHTETHNLQIKSKNLYSQAEQLLLTELGLADYVPDQVNISTRDLFECLQDDRFDAEYWLPKYDEIIERIKQYKHGYDTFDSLFTIGNQTSINLEKTYQYVELADVNSTLGMIENYTELLGKELPSRGRMSLKRGDVIMSSLDGSLNKTALVTSNGQNIIGSTGFFVLSRRYFEPEVALVLLKSKSIQEYIARQAQGTILTSIPKTSLSRVVLPKISKDIQSKVKNFVQEAHTNNEQSKVLLEKAKRAVEVFVEQDEAQAIAYLAS